MDTRRDKKAVADLTRPILTRSKQQLLADKTPRMMHPTMKPTIAEQDRQRNLTKFKKNFETKLGSLTNSIQVAEFGDKRSSKKIMINEYEKNSVYDDNRVDTPSKTRAKEMNNDHNLSSLGFCLDFILSGFSMRHP